MNVPKSAVRGRLVGIVGALSVALAAGAGQACAAPTTSPSASSHLSSAPSASTTPTTSGITSASPCGAMVGKPSTIHKVMVIVMENTTFGTVINSPQASTINNLATACGLASNFHGIQFPSLPNYIQLTSGTAPPSIAGNGVKGSDCAPSANCQSTDPSVFAQLESAGLSWKSYAESMPSNCYLSNTGEYVPRHNPATYYVNERASCAKFDVPMGSTSSGALLSDLQNGTLPAYSFVAPNMCNDGHDSCNGVPQVVEEDRFMADWLPQIIASPDYQNGSLTVVLTADTSSGSDPTNHLATIVVARSSPATQWRAASSTTTRCCA